MDEAGAGHAARVDAHTAVGARLARYGDRDLAEVVAAATRLGSGVGGRSAVAEVEGRRVFVKRVPLTQLELRPEHVRSTANLFELPLFYQYGIGSAGFGAWRELAAHLMTTRWVLRGEHAGFPLLYHWRVLPDSPPTGFADVFGGVEGAVAHWDGSPAVRRRLDAIGNSAASLVLFLEHLPWTLAGWLADTREAARQQAGGPGRTAETGPDAGVGPHAGVGPAYWWVEEQLRCGTAFMSARGLVHFDAHFANLLTDGRQIYFADFGLASSRDFALSPQETAFLADHVDYDRSYVPWHLLRHHLPDVVGEGTELAAFLRAWADGHRPEGVPPEIGAIIDRHGRHAAVLDDFHRRLLHGSKHTPFPAAEVGRALAGGRAPREAPRAR